MSDGNTTPERDQIRDAEISVFNAVRPHDESDMYVMEVLGLSVLVRRRRGGELYVHIDNESVPDGTPLAVEVCSSGDTDYVI